MGTNDREGGDARTAGGRNGRTSDWGGRGAGDGTKQRASNTRRTGASEEDGTPLTGGREGAGSNNTERTTWMGKGERRS